MRVTLLFIAALLFLACNTAGKKEKKVPDSTAQQNDRTRTDTGSGQTTNLSTDAAIVTDLVKKAKGAEWRLLTDKEALRDSFPEYIREVAEMRKTNPDAPFIVKGDFNGDGQPDYAALVTNDKKQYDRLILGVIFFPSGGKPVDLTEHYAFEQTLLKVVPASGEITGYDSVESDKERTLKLTRDAIEVSNWDAGGYWIYWDGKKFSFLFAEG